MDGPTLRSIDAVALVAVSLTQKLPARDWFGSRLLVNAFHRLWYHSYATWEQNRFLGHLIYQCPFDLQLYQELIFEKKPQAIVQTGICHGGSLLYFATMLDAIGSDAPVIGIDIELQPEAKRLSHPRIRTVIGDSVAVATVVQVKALLAGRAPLVILDSDHSRDHVLKELERYAPLVPVGGTLVVEDTNVNGHPVFPSFGPGPLEAVQIFLQTHPEFQADDRWRRMRFSFHQHGWLTRVR